MYVVAASHDDSLCVTIIYRCSFCEKSKNLHICYQIATIFPRGVNVRRCTNRSFIVILLIYLTYFGLFQQLMCLST